MARTVVFDFDGVIHSYTSGWKGETNIPDPPVPGIQEALKEIHDAGYEVIVVSTRCKTVLGRMAIENWLDMYGMTQEVDKVCKEKPPAIAYIDDRAICFDGHPETLLKKIQNFQPWYKTPTLTPPNEWVAVEERLPEYNPGTGAKSYWVAKKDNAGNWQMKIAQYCDYGYAMNVDAETEVTWRDWDFTKIANVTHWMLLPAPPDRCTREGEA